MNGYVYLIGEYNTPNKFKIGSTKQNDVQKRLKQLQTGNGEELYIKHTFSTNKPIKLEQMLHARFMNKKIMNEWFMLEEDDINNFVKTCEETQKTMDCLKDNPFF